MSNIGFIYKLVCKDVNIKEIYVGSTTNLKMRKHKHKSNCYNENYHGYNYKVYQFIRANGGYQNFDIIQVERVEYNTKYELHARERYFIEVLNARLNQRVPNRTYAEFYQDNKEKKILYQNQYDAKNREELLKTVHCACSGTYSKKTYSRHIKSQKHTSYLALDNQKVKTELNNEL